MLEGRQIDRSLGDRFALVLVAAEELLAGPALQYGGDLPGEVGRIADSRVEPVASPRWVQMRASPTRNTRRVPYVLALSMRAVHGSVDTISIAMSAEPDPSERSHEADRVGVAGVHVDAHRHRPPCVTEVHATDEPGDVRVEDPVVDRRAVRHQLVQPRSAEHHVEVGPSIGAALVGPADRPTRSDPCSRRSPARSCEEQVEAPFSSAASTVTVSSVSSRPVSDQPVASVTLGSRVTASRSTRSTRG